jgi:hypothetical protein
MARDGNKKQSFATLPLEAALPEIWFHMTESHPIQQSTGSWLPKDIAGAIFQISSQAISMRETIKKNTTLTCEEPKRFVC